MNRKEMLARLKAGENPLEVSIQKWVDLSNSRITYSVGQSNCALCELHNHESTSLLRRIFGRSKGWCEDCPVFKKTQTAFCQNTPFEQYATALFEGKTTEKKLRKIAKREVEFLKSLRKEAKE